MHKTIPTARRRAKIYVADGVQAHVLESADLILYEGDPTLAMRLSRSDNETNVREREATASAWLASHSW